MAQWSRGHWRNDIKPSVLGIVDCVIAFFPGHHCQDKPGGEGQKKSLVGMLTSMEVAISAGFYLVQLKIFHRA